MLSRMDIIWQDLCAELGVDTEFHREDVGVFHAAWVQHT